MAVLQLFTLISPLSTLCFLHWKPSVLKRHALLMKIYLLLRNALFLFTKYGKKWQMSFWIQLTFILYIFKKIFADDFSIWYLLTIPSLVALFLLPVLVFCYFLSVSDAFFFAERNSSTEEPEALQSRNQEQEGRGRYLLDDRSTDLIPKKAVNQMNCRPVNPQKPWGSLTQFYCRIYSCLLGRRI